MNKLPIILFLIGLSLPATAQEIEWIKIEDLEAAQAKESRKVFIDMYTDWCGWCKRMDKTTFGHPGIANFVNEKFYAVKFNAESKDSVLFQGQSFGFVKNGRRGYHELAATLMQGKLSYPTIVYLDENLSLIQPVPGYMSAQDFERILSYLDGDHHKEQPWEQYKKNYQIRFTAKKEKS